MKRTRLNSTASDPAKDFLALRGRARAARIIATPGLPRPYEAFLSGDGYLTWSWYASKKMGTNLPPRALQKPPATLCFDFAKLADGSNAQIRRFAAKWGPLAMQARVIEESVEDWRRYAQLAQALLRFTAQKLIGDRGRDEDWRTICESTPVRSLDRTRLPANAQMAITASAVNTWFATARGHRIMDMVDGKLQVRPNASNLFGILITQIAHVMARSDQLAVCAGCKDPFRPKRPLSRGDRQYCKRCRNAKVPQRDAARDWRRRARGRNLAPPIGS
jgi:hypothetical protein